MKQYKLAASIFVSASLLSSITFSQELQKDAALQAHNWTGLYGGLNLGLVKHTMSVTDNQAASFNATMQQVLDPALTGGLQVGYRYQLIPAMTSGVFGVEFSADFSNATFTGEYGSPFALYELEAVNTLKNTLLLQAIGGIAADKTLLFLAAGFSWTNVTGTIRNIDGLPFFNSFNVGDQVLGAAVGGGVEYAFNEKVSARVKIDVISANNYTTTDNTGNSYQISNHNVQGTVGVNYKFE